MKDYLKIYKLSHSHYRYSIYDVNKLLGYFSSMRKIEEAIDFYIKKPGFKNFDRASFEVKIYNLLKNKKNKYYIVYFVLEESEFDDFILFSGLFDSKRKVNIVINRFEKEFGDKFKCKKEIYETNFDDIDEMRWTSGFVSIN